MTEIVIKKACYIGGQVAEVDSVHDVDLPTATYLESIGRAERVRKEQKEASPKAKKPKSKEGWAA